MAIQFINGFEFYAGVPLGLNNAFKAETGLNVPRIPSGYLTTHNKDFSGVYVPSGNTWATMMLKKTDGVAVEVAAKMRYMARDSAAIAWATSLIFSPSSSPSNAVSIEIDLPSTSGTSIKTDLSKNINNVLTILSAKTITASEQVTSTTDMLLRLRKEGSIFKSKAWLDGTSEPVEWQIATIPEAASFNNVGILLVGGAQHVIIKNVSIATNGETAPLSSPFSTIVEGIIYKPDDTVAVGATVRLYHKESGVCIAEQTANEIGQYSFTVPISNTDLVQIVGVDQDNNEWKPPLHETYPIL